MNYLCAIFLLLISIHNNINCSFLDNGRNAHKGQSLTDEQIVALASLTDTENLENILKNIAIERVVGSEGHMKVKKYIINYLKELDWHVQRHGFQDDTPNFGKLKFENIIGTLNPEADRFLVLACHYDSKYMGEQKFIGATDSAVPCAMMLNLIYVMKPLLDQIKTRNDVSLKLVFFDGEEAFHEWGPKDSIYGARRLAAKLSNDIHRIKNNEVVTELARWDLLVLLDLLGTPDPTFYNYIHSGSKWYSKLLSSEQELARLNLLKNYSNGKPQQRYFRPVSMPSYIEDDHIPFLKRGVPIVHVIPSPFPDVWHTVYDDLNAIDISTVENLNKIFRLFVAKYLHLY